MVKVAPAHAFFISVAIILYCNKPLIQLAAAQFVDDGLPPPVPRQALSPPLQPPKPAQPAQPAQPAVPIPPNPPAVPQVPPVPQQPAGPAPGLTNHKPALQPPAPAAPAVPIPTLSPILSISIAPTSLTTPLAALPPPNAVATLPPPPLNDGNGKPIATGPLPPPASLLPPGGVGAVPAVPPKELAQYPTVMEVPRLRTIETVGVDGKATKVVTSDRVVYTQTFDKGPVEMWRFRAYGV